jgi:creatinine amidohydrolase
VSAGRRAVESLALVRARLDTVEAELSRALAGWTTRELTGNVTRVAAAGVGGSEGPARLFVAALLERGLAARYVPPSAFACGAPAPADATVLFTQGLSPNARLALAEGARGPRFTLVTSIAPDASAPPGDPRGDVARALADGGSIVVLPPASEGDLLVRVVGPTVASLGAALLATDVSQGRGPSDTTSLAGLREAPARYAAARARARAAIARIAAELPHERIALVTAGGHGERCQGLRSKLLEALGVAEPPLWDVLQLAHGPFQQIHGDRWLLVALVTSAAEEWLFDRLEAMVLPGRHRVLRLDAAGGPATAFFEHAAGIDELVLAQLEARPRDLLEWPGKGEDEPLYGVGRAPRSA